MSPLPSKRISGIQPCSLLKRSLALAFSSLVCRPKRSRTLEASPKEILNSQASICEKTAAAENEILVSEGHRGSAVYLIIKGRVKVLLPSRRRTVTIWMRKWITKWRFSPMSGFPISESPKPCSCFPMGCFSFLSFLSSLARWLPDIPHPVCSNGGADHCFSEA